MIPRNLRSKPTLKSRQFFTNCLPFSAIKVYFEGTHHRYGDLGSHLFVPDVRAIPEEISILIRFASIFVSESYASHPKLVKSAQLTGFRDAVMVGINPKSQFRVDSISETDEAIIVSVVSKLRCARACGAWCGKSVHAKGAK